MAGGDESVYAAVGIIQDDSIELNDCVLEGPEFYERMGGLLCKTCNTVPPCECPMKKKNEVV